MSTARHHAEWLSLVEASGPFLSLPVLLKTFPAGLDAHDPEHLKLLRSAYEEWQDNQLGLKPEPVIHRAWVEFILKQTLELPEEVLQSGQRIPSGLSVTVAEQNETLRPDWVVVNPTGTADAGKPRLLVQIVPAEQGLEKPLKGSRWAASPATRMMELLHACNVRLGLVTNGEHWMLVNAPKGETTGFISWYSTLWVEEYLTLRAFQSLLGVRRFFGVDDSETLEALLTQSLTDQQEVTDQLGYQVRQAVEVLVQASARLDQDQNGTLLKNIPESQLYEAALTVMMRLVFLFCAEERGLLLLGDPIYDQHYAVSTLREQLRSHADQHGEEVLERRSDAWCRLLATFRAVYGGIFHDTLQLPAYGGSLFDPDRFPFLEGRVKGTEWQTSGADPLRINNRIVLHLLEALQILQIRVQGAGVEPRRLSFRALDIEQIGHVYEGLLDHTAVRATSTVLGLVGTRYEEPEVELSELERFQSQGEAALLPWLKEQTGRSPSALKKALSAEIEPRDQQRLRTACNNDPQLFDRVLPFAGLIRQDTLGYPVVILEGSVYVTEGVDRRQTGTHYTPRNLTEEIVQYTLEPLVFEGVAEGKPKEQWGLRSAAELLQLKICDMAMGSGAFLVQTCRYLAGKLVEAWQQAEAEHPGQVVIAPEGTLSGARPDECPIPKDLDERLLVARRIVADRCLYGVDKNPLAVEMAKLSLWLVTLAKGRPFTFLDHALKWGDSLLGITRAEQIEYLHLNPDNEVVQYPIASQIWRPILQDAIAKRRKLESFSVNGIEDLQEKERLFQEAEQAIDRLRFVGDYLIGRALADAGKTSDLTTEDLMVVSQRIEQELAGKVTEEQTRDITALKASAERMLNLGNPVNQPLRKPFHWLLEFPEVLLEGETKGFAAIVGNPPFLAGRYISSTLGQDYLQFLQGLAFGLRGQADLCAAFATHGMNLAKGEGCIGLILTKTIAEGDTRDAFLKPSLSKGLTLTFVRTGLQWSGNAQVVISLIVASKCEFEGVVVLNDQEVECIDSTLSAISKSKTTTYELKLPQSIVFKGIGLGDNSFVIEPEDKVIESIEPGRFKRYITGVNHNSSQDGWGGRYVFYFQDIKSSLELEELEAGKEFAKRSLSEKEVENKFWLFRRSGEALYSFIEKTSFCIIRAQTSSTWSFSLWNRDDIFDQTIIVFCCNCKGLSSVLNSSIHEVWATKFGRFLRTDFAYAPSNSFYSFPLPYDPISTTKANLSSIAEKLDGERKVISTRKNTGLTKIYASFHDPNETADDIQKLRELHIEMDREVATAYGWQDLDLGHDFHITKQGIRFTISETARREVLDRLLELNHQRYAEEVAQGLHDKKKTKGKGKRTPSKAKPSKTDSEEPMQGSLF